MTVLRREPRAIAPFALLFVLGTALLTVSTASLASAEDAPRLLLLPIVVHSSEDPEYLRDGLSDMLAARFARIGALDLVRSPADSRGATNVEDALKLARKAGADYVLYGSFTRFGQGASLDVQCSPVADDKLRDPLREIFVHSGSIGEIIPDLDELAGKVSRFAMGEDVASSAPAAPAGGPARGAITNRAIRDLSDRVQALEAALTELLEASTEAGTDG
jgi:TolB-like protein